jgi:hypothetical protein
MLERAMNTVRGMEDVANWISDMDRSWWPFGFLRPVPDARISSFRVALIAMLYGVFAGMLASALVAVSLGTTGHSVVALPALTTVGFFVVYRLTFAYFWNRRAERLAAGERAQ